MHKNSMEVMFIIRNYFEKPATFRKFKIDGIRELMKNKLKTIINFKDIFVIQEKSFFFIIYNRKNTRKVLKNI